MIKKILKFSGFALLGLLVIAFLIPIVFKKQVRNLIKKEINKSINAKVEFSDVSLSLFRHFPRIGIVIKDLSIVGLDEFSRDTLIATKKVDASAGLFSILKGKDIKVSSVSLESPRIHALVTKEGKANWDIAKASSDTSADLDTSASAFQLTLKNYELHDAYILYRDDQAGSFLELEGLDHRGSGNLTADVFTLSTRTDAASATLIQDNIPYLLNTRSKINSAIRIDNTTNTYAFKTDEIELNNLALNAEGSIQLVNDSTYNFDLKFKSPSNDFKDILSMIPAIYKKDFEKIKTSGSAAFNGFVKGTYSPHQMPAYDVNLDVKNGSFQYPDLPKPVKNIQFALQASNVDGQPDNAIINIPAGHLEMNNEPFDFRFIFKNPETTQLLDFAAKGKLDLSQVSQFVKLENGIKLGGQLWADAFIKGPLKAIQSQSGSFTAGGFFDIKDLYYSDNTFPQPIQHGNIRATLENSGGVADNTVVNISSGHLEVGSDPVDFTLQLKNPVTSMDFSGKAKGRFTLDHIKQFTKLEPGTSISGVLDADLSMAGSKSLIDQKKYDQIVVLGTSSLTNMKYVSKDYPGGISIAAMQLRLNPKNVQLESLNGNYMHTNFSASGIFNNLIGYAMEGENLGGNLNLAAGKLNLNEWMGTDTSTTNASTSSGPFLVPKGLNFTVHAKSEAVQYDKVSYNNVNGDLQIADETVTLKNVRTEALEGSLVFNGTYSTKLDKKDPAIALSYQVVDLDVQKVFYAFNSIQKLMPIGEFLAGKLNSQLSMTGKLNSSMMPLLSSLTGKGNLLLLDGVFKKLGPLEKLGTLLQIDHLKAITIKEVKNYIEFANGKVLVKPFTIHIKDIEMQIGGVHGIDQSVDYLIQMKVPRSYMGKSGNDLVNGLAAKAVSKGLPFKLGDMVNLNIKMLGTLSNPDFKIDLKEMAADMVKDLEKQAVDFVKEKADSLKARAKDSLDAVKAKAIDDLKKDLKDKVFGKKDSANAAQQDTVKKNTGQAIKNKLKDLLKKPKKPASDTTKKG